MSSKGKTNSKKREQDELNKEMISYYRRLNEEAEKQEKLKSKKILPYLLITAIAAILFYFILYNLFPKMRGVILTGSVTLITIIICILFASSDLKNNKWLITVSLALIELFFIYVQIEIFTTQTQINERQTQILEKTAPTLDPNIKISLENKYHSTRSLASLEGQNDKDYGPRYGVLSLKIINDGQRPTGYMYLYLIDLNKTYHSFTRQPEGLNLNGLSHNFTLIYLRHDACGKDENSFDLDNEKCEAAQKSIKTGLKNFILVLDCPGCAFQEEERCYNFNMCIYNNSSEKEKCESKLINEGPYLEVIDCPVDWRKRV